MLQNIYTYVRVISFCFCLLLLSCENKHDVNGQLDGMWQLIEWRDTFDLLQADKNSRIFYSIQLELVQFRDFAQGKGNYYLAYFRHTKDSLIIYRPIDFSHDSIVDLSELKPFGVPADGRFHIDHLNNDILLLNSKEGRLRFRKY